MSVRLFIPEMVLVASFAERVAGLLVREGFSIEDRATAEAMELTVLVPAWGLPAGQRDTKELEMLRGEVERYRDNAGMLQGELDRVREELAAALAGRGQVPVPGAGQTVPASPLPDDGPEARQGASHPAPGTGQEDGRVGARLRASRAEVERLGRLLSERDAKIDRLEAELRRVRTEGVPVAAKDVTAAPAVSGAVRLERVTPASLAQLRTLYVDRRWKLPRLARVTVELEDGRAVMLSLRAVAALLEHEGVLREADRRVVS